MELAGISATASALSEDTTDVPKVIWIYWNSGFESAPSLVKLSKESWCVMNPDYDVRALDEDSVRDYLDIPQLFKIASVRIEIAGKSDFLRSYLLSVHGGVWVDCTTFCLKPLNQWLPSVTRRCGLLSFRQGPEVNDRQLISWFIAAAKGNPIATGVLEECRAFLFKARQRTLTLNRFTAYDYPGILREGTGFTTLEAMEKDGYFPYFYFHYLFNEVVAEGPARIAWEILKESSNNCAQPNQSLDDAYVSKQTYKGNYLASENYAQRRRFIETLLKQR